MKSKTYIYKTIKECEIKANFYSSEQKGKVTPIIVYIHGGCLMGGSRNMIDSRQLELYIQAGFSVISIDYRLAPESSLSDIIDDLKDFFVWLEKSADELGIDIQKLGVVGHSAGGYLALMSGFCVTPKPKVIVSVYGYGDLVGEWLITPSPFYCNQGMISEEESEINKIKSKIISESYDGRWNNYKLYPYYRQHGIWTREVSRHNPITEASYFTPYCPLQNITEEYPPTLFIHGENDNDVPYEQSILMVKELKKHKVANKFITIPKGVHGFDVPNEDLKGMDESFVISPFKDIVKYFNKYLKAT